MTTPTTNTADGPRPVGGSYTFGGRTGRISPTRKRALDELVPRYVVHLPFPADERLVVEIGCGKGDATAAMAPADRGTTVIACEPNSATVAHLATLLDATAVDNVRVWIGDAFDVLTALGPRRVGEIRVWFPDPWPKPRHFHKRLVTPQRLALLVEALEIGGRIRLATDEPAYAAEALAAMHSEPRLDARVVDRPAERPITTFEARGLRAGRFVTDIEARRIC